MDFTALPLSDCLRGSEAEMLCFALDRVRRQFAWKTGGLDADQLRRQHPPSTMTLAGLIKHMAFVEEGSPRPLTLAISAHRGTSVTGSRTTSGGGTRR